MYIRLHVCIALFSIWCRDIHCTCFGMFCIYRVCFVCTICLFLFVLVFCLGWLAYSTPLLFTLLTRKLFFFFLSCLLTCLLSVMHLFFHPGLCPIPIRTSFSSATPSTIRIAWKTSRKNGCRKSAIFVQTFPKYLSETNRTYGTIPTLCRNWVGSNGNRLQEKKHRKPLTGSKLSRAWNVLPKRGMGCRRFLKLPLGRRCKNGSPLGSGGANSCDYFRLWRAYATEMFHWLWHLFESSFKSMVLCSKYYYMYVYISIATNIRMFRTCWKCVCIVLLLVFLLLLLLLLLCMSLYYMDTRDMFRTICWSENILTPTANCNGKFVIDMFHVYVSLNCIHCIYSWTVY